MLFYQWRSDITCNFYSGINTSRSVTIITKASRIMGYV